MQYIEAKIQTAIKFVSLMMRDGTSKIDFVLLSKKCILIIESLYNSPQKKATWLPPWQFHTFLSISIAWVW